MDHTSIPECALYRNTGTVIVRLKMEVTTSCCKREVCPASSLPEVVHRLAGCEQCTRTRLINQYSDCDSDIVQKCRPYRSSAARSRYVNVCAAVCLLLLVGGLSPRSSAAPHRSRSSMARPRRALQDDKELWENPCDFQEDKTAGARYEDGYLVKASRNLVTQARAAYVKTLAYSDKVVRLYDSSANTKFEDILQSYSSEDWLRKTYAGEALPLEKVFDKSMTGDYVKSLMNDIDQQLPIMYTALQMILAGLQDFYTEGLDSNVQSDYELQENIKETKIDVRSVLCHFYGIMNANKLEMKPLVVDNMPKPQEFGLLLYRDTLSYLEYLVQVFTAYAEKQTSKNR